MVLFDSSFLYFLFANNPGELRDPATELPVERISEKIEHLLDTIDGQGEKILIPTPALSEILCLADETPDEVLVQLNKTYGFEIVPFDQMAAVEAALITAGAIAKGDKRNGSGDTWAKVKFDRQIMAIAKVRSVNVVYSNDKHIREDGSKMNIQVISVWELPDPPPKQTQFHDVHGDFGSPDH